MRDAAEELLGKSSGENGKKKDVVVEERGSADGGLEKGGDEQGKRSPLVQRDH